MSVALEPQTVSSLPFPVQHNRKPTPDGCTKDTALQPEAYSILWGEADVSISHPAPSYLLQKQSSGQMWTRDWSSFFHQPLLWMKPFPWVWCTENTGAPTVLVPPVSVVGLAGEEHLRLPPSLLRSREHPAPKGAWQRSVPVPAVGSTALAQILPRERSRSYDKSHENWSFSQRNWLYLKQNMVSSSPRAPSKIMELVVKAVKRRLGDY